MSITVIHQPDFIPYLGFFHRLAQADLWIVLDDVLVSFGGADSWVHRDKILHSTGPKWLTLPIDKATRRKPLCSIEIQTDPNWKSNHMEQIKSCYLKAPYFLEIWPLVEEIYSCETHLLREFTRHSIQAISSRLHLSINSINASFLKVEGRSNERLANLLIATKSTLYLSGTGAIAYIDQEFFSSKGIKILWQKFNHPKYDQWEELDFTPNLSALDYLFFCGIEQGQKLVTQWKGLRV